MLYACAMHTLGMCCSVLFMFDTHGLALWVSVLYGVWRKRQVFKYMDTICTSYVDTNIMKTCTTSISNLRSSQHMIRYVHHSSVCVDNNHDIE